jgi:bifunctional polynucleotide phosphatase/kinase
MPVKRKATITAFFKPAKVSKRETDALVPGSDAKASVAWTLHGSLLKARYALSDASKSESERSRRLGIAAFDLDSTLVETTSATPFPRSGSDWKWMDAHVKEHLRSICNGTIPPGLEDKLDQSVDYRLVVFSNQGGVVSETGKKRYIYLKERVTAIAKDLGVSMLFYGATKPKKGSDDKYRKPLRAMWDVMVDDLVKDDQRQIDLEGSFFVGDAAGRPSDFSDSDAEFAKVVGLKFFTPEQFFQSANNDGTNTDQERA